MPQQIVVDGITRDFVVALPIGWERWIEKLGRGLPSVVAFHGGLQAPAAFMNDWPFHSIIDGSRPDTDRFVVFYPFGATPGGGALPEARAWNTNWTSGNYQDVDDIVFVTAMRNTVQSWMASRLAEAGISYTGEPLDENRRFLFGYSLGGMFAFQYARFTTNTFAAIWAESATLGGRRHMKADLATTVSNLPQPGLDPRAKSLFLHTGVMDENVVPGGTATAGPNLSTTNSEVYRDVGGLGGDWPDHYARGDLPALATVEAYKTLNAATVQSTLSSRPDRNGGNTSTLTQWRRSGGANNPIVEHYSDPTMDHTNFPGSPNRYFDVADVWAWFKAHPRVS
ncbi:MAG: hypothetical protein R3F61_23485 [Myxococcota bacterium]